MSDSSYERETEKLVRPILDKEGFELVDTEYVKEAGTWYLRVYIDKEGGITSDDTALVCRQLSDLMDEKNFIKSSYILEVSSPGLTRPFKKSGDYLRNIGKDVEFKLFSPIEYEDGDKVYKAKEFVGVLKSYDEDENKILVGFDDWEREFYIKDITMIRPYIEF